MNNHEVLSKHFTEKEIQSLKERPDYNKVMKMVQSLRINERLDLLADKVEEQIKGEELDLNAKFEKFKKEVEMLSQKQANNLAIEQAEKVLPGSGEVIKKLGYFEKAMDGLSRGFGKILEGKITAGISIIISSVFGDIFGKKKNAKDGNSVEISKVPKEDLQDGNESIKSSFATKFFVDYAYEGDNNEEKSAIQGIVQKNTFQNLTLGELDNTINDNSKIVSLIKKIYGNIRGRPSIETFKKALLLFQNGSKGRDLISNLCGEYGEESPEKNKIKDIMTYIGKDMSLLGDLSNGSIEDIFAKGTRITDINNYIDENGEIKDVSLGEGFSKKLLTHISNTSYNVIDHNIELIIADKDFTQKEKGRLSGIISFGKNIQEEFHNSQVNLGIEGVSEAFKEKPLTLKEATALYVAIGPEGNFSKMNSMKQTSVYIAMIKLLDGRSDREQGDFMVKLGKKMLESSKNNVESINLPEGVILILSTIGETTKKLAMSQLKDKGNTILGALSNNPELILIIGFVVIMYPISKRTNILSGILATSR